jgi:SAM-dependent methyltransferase
MTLGSTVNLPSESFDAVVAAGVLTHGHAPPEAVDRILGVTKPGGTIVFSLSTIAHEAGFADKLDSLEASGAWSKVEQSDLFQTFPFSETEGHLRHWVFANQKA